MTKNLKYITIALVAVITVVIGVVIYRMFFQFSAKDVMAYAKDAAAKYKDSAAAYAIIMDGVEHILSSHNLTQQVLKTSRATGIDKEQELVACAVAQCKAYSYIK